jgi:ribosomal protein S18 acetylase RimI-like enzyme
MQVLRQAGPADAPALRALTREAYAKWVPVTGREPLPMRVDYAEAVLSHRFDLLYEDGTLAALIETAGEADHLLIVNVAVATAYRGRGFGRQLLAHAERLAAGGGFAEIRLYTNRLMAANIALYRSLGYRIDREEEMASGTAVHMSKPVRRPA